MFGNRTLSRSIIKVSEEGAKQHEFVNQEIKKLAEITGTGWDLTQSDLFDKVRKKCFLEGAGVFAVGFVGSYAVLDWLEKRRMKKKLKNEEQNSKEESP